MAPWLPRMHLFEIHDQPWQVTHLLFLPVSFSLSLSLHRSRPKRATDKPNLHTNRFPPWFRAKVQASLTETWTMTLRPLGQRESPALIASRILAAELGDRVDDYVFVDYCAGGGGPTPSIERYINAQRGGSSDASPSRGKEDREQQQQQQQQTGENGVRTRAQGKKNSTANTTTNGSVEPNPLVHFVLTDLHPHIPNWARAASLSPQIHHAPFPVDASRSPRDLLARASPSLPASHSSKKTFRTFHLAFHHFPDPLAASILRDTLSSSDGLAIVELQDRSLRSFLAVLLLGLGVMFFAPYYAWRWRSPGTLFWCWVIPILPFVLVWDGWMSSVRTRTVSEVMSMMRTCGIAPHEVEKWDVKSGRITHLPPCADVNWIIATKRQG